VAHSGFPEVQAVYGMNAASLEIFREANRRGLACILEQCIAPYQVLNRLMAEEYALWPGWEAGEAWQPSDRLASREVQEWVLADAILAGSPFVIANLPQEAAVQEKILLVPYAVDTDAYRTVALTPQAASEDSLKVLFLGGVGLRKGIQYLHRAVELLGSAKITVSAVGAVSVNPAAARQLSRRMSLHGLVPRAEVMQWLSWADVVVLPSICEGSAVATYEALAAGLPVIATPNAGAPILDSQTGFIVPVRDPSAIAERLEQLASSPRLRQEMGQSARRYAEEHLSWEAYAERLLAACETALQRRQCAA
jgi:glycosyltransferase involved in cell wall biosynthesis